MQVRAANDNESLNDVAPPTRAQTIAIAVWVVTLVLLGYWLVDHIVASVHDQDCFARGGSSRGSKTAKMPYVRSE
jgi:hypothetical protein